MNLCFISIINVFVSFCVCWKLAKQLPTYSRRCVAVDLSGRGLGVVLWTFTPFDLESVLHRGSDL